MDRRIAVLPGDGIGSDVVGEAVNVLKSVAREFDHTFHFSYGAIGGEAVDQIGTPLPADTLEACRHSDAVLLGAVGSPKWGKC